MIMTNDRCLNLLKDVRTSLKSLIGTTIDVNFDENRLTGNGSVQSEYHHVNYAWIGIEELSSDSSGYVSEYIFMKAFMSVLHETTHIYQCEKVFDESNPSAKYLSLGRVASQCSRQYYEDNYKLMPHEISAQYSALKNGYKILSAWYGEAKANDMVCNYVNRHIEDEFISKPDEPYEDVYNIFQDYKSVFKKSKTMKREVNFDSLKKYAESLSDNEMDMMSYHIVYGRTDWIDYVRNVESGIEQDFFLSGFLLLHEEEGKEIRYNLKSLSNMNFEYKIPSFKHSSKSIRNIDLDDITPDLSNVSVSNNDMEFL